MVLAGYFGAVVGVGEAAQRTGLVAVVVLALLAASARDRVRRGVDRLLFGYRRDPDAVVSRVGRRLDDASGPLDALRQLTVESRTVLRLPFAEVLPDDPGLPPVESGRSVAWTQDVPVTVQGRHVATLRVGRRHNSDRFRPDELSALTDVARQAGALVQAAIDGDRSAAGDDVLRFGVPEVRAEHERDARAVLGDRGEHGWPGAVASAAAVPYRVGWPGKSGVWGKPPMKVGGAHRRIFCRLVPTVKVAGNRG